MCGVSLLLSGNEVRCLICSRSGSPTHVLTMKPFLSPELFTMDIQWHQREPLCQNATPIFSESLSFRRICAYSSLGETENDIRLNQKLMLRHFSQSKHGFKQRMRGIAGPLFFSSTVCKPSHSTLHYSHLSLLSITDQLWLVEASASLFLKNVSPF